MLTKILTAVVLTGALVVAGDATFDRIGCPLQALNCCMSTQSCCSSTTQNSSESESRIGNCCSAPSRGAKTVAKSSCCSQEKSCCSTTTKTVYGDAILVYCTRTGEIYEGCCCEIVNGRYRCTVTGGVADECCCVPID